MTTNPGPATPTPVRRDQQVTLLRKLADLLESNHDIVCHGIDAAFFPNTPGQVQAIMTALDLPWTLDEKEAGGRIFFKGSTTAVGVSEDFDATIFCIASEVCTKAGERTVTDWRPAPEIAAFLGKEKG